MDAKYEKNKTIEDIIKLRHLLDIGDVEHGSLKIGGKYITYTSKGDGQVIIKLGTLKPMELCKAVISRLSLFQTTKVKGKLVESLEFYKGLKIYVGDLLIDRTTIGKSFNDFLKSAKTSKIQAYYSTVSEVDTMTRILNLVPSSFFRGNCLQLIQCNKVGGHNIIEHTALSLESYNKTLQKSQNFVKFIKHFTSRKCYKQATITGLINEFLLAPESISSKDFFDKLIIKILKDLYENKNDLKFFDFIRLLDDIILIKKNQTVSFVKQLNKLRDSEALLELELSSIKKDRDELSLSFQDRRELTEAYSEELSLLNERSHKLQHSIDSTKEQIKGLKNKISQSEEEEKKLEEELDDKSYSYTASQEDMEERLNREVVVTLSIQGYEEFKENVNKEFKAISRLLQSSMQEYKSIRLSKACHSHDLIVQVVEESIEFLKLYISGKEGYLSLIALKNLSDSERSSIHQSTLIENIIKYNDLVHLLADQVAVAKTAQLNITCVRDQVEVLKKKNKALEKSISDLSDKVREGGVQREADKEEVKRLEDELKESYEFVVTLEDEQVIHQQSIILYSANIKEISAELKESIGRMTKVAEALGAASDDYKAYVLTEENIQVLCEALVNKVGIHDEVAKALSSMYNSYKAGKLEQCNTVSLPKRVADALSFSSPGRRVSATAASAAAGVDVSTSASLDGAVTAAGTTLLQGSRKLSTTVTKSYSSLPDFSASRR